MKYLFLLLAASCSLSSFAQALFPHDGAQLRRTQVMFEYPDVPGATYRFELYDESDTAHVVKLTDTLLKQNVCFVRTNMHFGKAYRWKYTAQKAQASVFESPVYHFRTLSDPLVDTMLHRLSIRKAEKGKYADGIVFIDGFNAAVDRQGAPVWYTSQPGNSLRDVNLAADGSVTMLNGTKALATDLEGNLLWEGPDDQLNDYHHDMIKLRNGNYLVCGLTQIANESPAALAGPAASAQQGRSINSATILEITPARKIVWRFDLVPEMKRNFGTKFESQKMMKRLGHLNGLAIDENNHIIYASFKNFSSVFKIDQRTNDVVNIFGNSQFSLLDSTQAGKFFSAQHSPILLTNGNLMVFNNDLPGVSSSIVELRNPLTRRDDEKVWEYRFEDAGVKYAHTNHMGSVQELPNGNFLVCAGNLNNRVFEVTRDKKLVWDAFLEKTTGSPDPASMWEYASTYKAFFATSLYPYYFSLQSAYAQPQLTSAGLGKGVKLIINNAGSQPDTYEVSAETRAGNVISKVLLVTLKPNQSNTATVMLAPPVTVRKGEELKIKVRSLTSNVSRQLIYHVQ